MYNISIADDEPIVIESLRFILDREFPGVFNCFDADSGLKVIQICRTQKIDLAFIDINMPGINGLEAIREIKQFNPSIVIIILSAFDRFNYAQEALELGVFKYLTKPLNKSTAVQTLKDAISFIESQNGKVESYLAAREKLHAVLPVVESDFIYSLIYPVDDNKDVSSYLSFFNMTCSAYFFCTLEIPHIIPENRLNLYNQVHDLVSKSTECVIGPLMLNRIIVFFPLKKFMEPDEMRLFVQQLYHSLAMQISAGIKLGISSIDDDLKHSVKMYNQSLSALTAMPPEKNGIAFYDNKKTFSDLQSAVCEKYKDLISLVKSGDLPGVTNVFNSALPLFSEFYGGDLPCIKNILFELLVNARIAAHEADNSFAAPGAFPSTFSAISEIKSLEMLRPYILSCLAGCVQVFLNNQHFVYSPQIEKIRAYINEHLAENISLEDAAEIVKMHPVYVSKLFKTETGENFTDFVTGLRISKAKELLKSSLKTIKEVTFAVGYNDQNYFSRLFKKQIGQTPTEFRGGLNMNGGNDL